MRDEFGEVIYDENMRRVLPPELMPLWEAELKKMRGESRPQNQNINLVNPLGIMANNQNRLPKSPKTIGDMRLMNETPMENVIGDNVYGQPIYYNNKQNLCISSNRYMAINGTVLYIDERYDTYDQNARDNFNVPSVSVKTAYLNFTNHKDVTIINRSGFKFPIKRSDDIDINNFMSMYYPKRRKPAPSLEEREKLYHDGLVDFYNDFNNKIVIMQEYTLDSLVIDKLHEYLIKNMFDSIDDNFTKFVSYIARNSLDFNNVVNGSLPNLKIKIMISYIIDADKLVEDEKFLSKVKNTGDMIYIGKYDNCPVRSIASTYMNLEVDNILKQNDLENGYSLKVVNNKGGMISVYYYNFEQELVRVNSEVNVNMEDGIHLFSFKLKDVYENNTVVKKWKVIDKIIPFNNCEASGFYLNDQVAMSHGNDDGKYKIELSKVNNEKINLENIKIQMAKDLHEKDMELAHLKSELDIIKLEKDRALEQLKLEKAKEMADIDIEKAKVTNHYTERSLDRKDTSESIKMMPAVIGAVAGIIGVGVGVLAKSAGVGLVAVGTAATGAVTTGTLITTMTIIGAYEIGKRIANSKIISKASKAIWNGAKSLTTMAYDGVCAVGRTAWSGVKSVGNFIGDTVGSVVGGISDFVFGF